MIKMARPPPDPLYSFHGSMSCVNYLLPVISGTRQLLYAATNEGYVHVWDFSTKRERAKHDVGRDPCLSIVYTNVFITQLKGDSIKFWNEKDNVWNLIKIVSNEYCGFCHMLSFDNTIFLPDNDGQIIIYDITKNKETIVGNNRKVGQLMCLKMIKSTEKLLAAFESGNICVFDNHLNELSNSKFFSDCPMALDYCSETSEGITGTVTETFYKFTYHASDHSVIKLCEMKMTNAGVGSVAINKAGTLCILGCWDGRLRYYSMKKLQLLAVLIHHTEALQYVTFVNDKLTFCESGAVIAGGKDGRISLWNLFT